MAESDLGEQSAVGGWWNPFRWSLSAQILLAVLVGAAIGMIFRNRPFIPDVPGFTTAELGQLGSLVIRLLTTLAIPLILFAVLDAFVKTSFTGRQGARFVAICIINLVAASVIGLTVMNVFQPGLAWRDQLERLSDAVDANGQAPQSQLQEGVTLSPLKNLDGHIPKNIVAPFLETDVIGLVLLAAILGVAFRHVRAYQIEEGSTSYLTVEAFIETMYQVFMRGLSLVVRLVPFAMLTIVAKVVGESGVEVFSLLGGYLFFILLGLFLHSLVYYPLSAWIGGGRPPWVYLGRGIDAVGTGFSANSSLAAVPVTLRCLTERMGVSQPSARLSACIGTNFNNDGITLYEAMSVLFVSQAIGTQTSIGSQVVLILASLMASVGVAGVPASGLVVLPLVLKSAGMSDEVIALVIPLMQSVDWILARLRSAINVLGDMQVAILLDGRTTSAPAATTTNNREI